MSNARELAEFAAGYGSGSFAVGKNKIINGAMTIDQRNAGASVSNAGGTTTYALDRWAYYATSSSKFTIQQSSTAPAGFSNSMLITSSAATTIGSGDEYWLMQKIEGFNTADLNWGTSDAKTVTLSFRVRSSLTGTFGGSIANSALNYYYAFNYTISAADTWETKTITITAPTAGTWVGATNGTGMFVIFGLSAGTTYGGATPGSWTSASYKVLPTGAVNILETSGATWYITGVQLEEGSVATPFENRLYPQELALCQRYFVRFEINDNFAAHPCWAYSANAGSTRISLPITMRSAPTLTYSGTIGDASKDWSIYNNGSWLTLNLIQFVQATTESFRVNLNPVSGLSATDAFGFYAPNTLGGAGLTATSEL